MRLRRLPRSFAKSAVIRSSKSLIEKLQKRLNLWDSRLRKSRFNSTLFLMASSFVNIDILTFDYILNAYKSLEYEEFKRVILSIKTFISRGSRFYVNLSDHTFYSDGYDYDYYDRFNLTDNIVRNCQGMKYLNNTQELDAGLDVGNMMSLIIGQDQGTTYRVMKNFFTIPPDWIRELADQFIEYFKPHKYKLLNLYYDRAANAYASVKKDFASQIKHAIEFDSMGVPTGWDVLLKSEGQGNILHAEEYDLMNVWMGEKDNRFPKLLIDKYECKELRSSLYMAPIFKDSKGNIKKDKSSEKRVSNDRLPMESTNMSDAFKYLMCRKKWLKMVKRKEYHV